MKCKYCQNEMRLDDVDYNFKYWCCDNCKASAFEKIRYVESKFLEFGKGRNSMKECEHYDNWCEKEKRTCKNCYYENTKDKEEIKTMVEDIEEALQEKYKNLKIEVNYVKIKMYSIKIGTKTIFYEWKDNLTFSANIESIKYYIDLIIGGMQ